MNEISLNLLRGFIIGSSELGDFVGMVLEGFLFVGFADFFGGCFGCYVEGCVVVDVTAGTGRGVGVIFGWEKGAEEECDDVQLDPIHCSLE